jgi:hypothetical protein
MSELTCEGDRQDTDRGTAEQDRRKSKNSTEKRYFSLLTSFSVENSTVYSIGLPLGVLKII